MLRNTRWWNNTRMVKRGLDMSGFFLSKSQKDKKTRSPGEMATNAEDRQDYLAYLQAHEGVTVSQLSGLETDEVLSLPPPLDPPEYWVSSGPRFAPLLGGTAFGEVNEVNERLQQNAARDSERALRAGRPDPWAGAPYPPHHHIPELARPRHPSPRRITAGVPGKSARGKSAASQLVSRATAAEEYPQLQLRGNSRKSQDEVRGKGGQSAPTQNTESSRGALPTIRETGEMRETVDADTPLASIEAVPAASRGTKRSAPSPAADGERFAKITKSFTSALDLVKSPSSLLVDPAVAAAALANARPVTAEERARLRRAPKCSTSEEAEDERVTKRQRRKTWAEPTRRGARLTSRGSSTSVTPEERPVPQSRATPAAAAAAPLPPQSKSEKATRSSSAVPTAASKPTPKSSSRANTSATKSKPAPKSTSTKSNTLTKNKGKGKANDDTSAKPKRKKVQKACDECRRKHVSCKHGVNAPDYVPHYVLPLIKEDCEDSDEEDGENMDPATQVTTMPEKRPGDHDDATPPIMAQS